ncbi:MAG: pseudouridine synthase [Acidobacteriota bacterium]
MERVQKIIAAAGVASRRAAEEMILRGEVTINGEVARLGSKADPARDHIKVKGRLINPQLARREKKYFLLNKPRGYLSSVSDPQRRPLVMELLPAGERKGLHPVGRLDFNSEGLIILTNDGELTRLITEGRRVEKLYHVKVKGAPAPEMIENLRRGISINGRRTQACGIRLLEKTKESGNTWYEVALREGRNQQIRRMFDSINHSVVKLRRVAIGHLTDKGLLPGHYRQLAEAEVKKFFQSAPRDGGKDRPSRPNSRRKPR